MEQDWRGGYDKWLNGDVQFIPGLFVRREERKNDWEIAMKHSIMSTLIFILIPMLVLKPPFAELSCAASILVSCFLVLSGRGRTLRCAVSLGGCLFWVILGFKVF